MQFKMILAIQNCVYYKIIMHNSKLYEKL